MTYANDVVRNRSRLCVLRKNLGPGSASRRLHSESLFQGASVAGVCRWGSRCRCSYWRLESKSVDLAAMNSSDKETDAIDPLAASPPLMPAGSKYVGQPIDVTSRRSICIWRENGSEPLIGPQDEQVIFDHFYHDGRFWRAIVPLDSVERVYGQAFNFSEARTRVGKNGRELVLDKRGWPKRKIPFLYHVQSRFQLSPDRPIELYPLESREFGTPHHVITDFVYSLEALGPVGWDFNLKAGLSGDLITAHRFMSVQDMVFERIVVENQYVSQTPPLPLDAAARRELLVRSIRRSHAAGMGEKYYLYRCCATNNCTSSPFKTLDSVVRYRWYQRLGAFFYRLPISPRFYLRIRGLDTDPERSSWSVMSSRNLSRIPRSANASGTTSGRSFANAEGPRKTRATRKKVIDG